MAPRVSLARRNGKGRKVPHALEFTKLRVIPDQMYFDVAGVRTADEALITIRVMVFFELVEIERMLAQTHDPVADYIDALTAGVVRFAGACDFGSFKTDAAALNDLATYTQLTRGAERIGYHVSKVVYRGYLAPENLQRMHDNAIETRTRLVLEAEAEKRQQEITDLQQARGHERAALERLEEQRHLDHHLAQSRQTRQEELASKRETEQLAIELLAQRHAAEQDHRRKLLELRSEEWQNLQQAGADLTAVLVAQEHNPDKLIRLEQSPGGKNPVYLHDAI